MPTATKDYTLIASHVSEIFTIPVEYHIVKAISLYRIGGLSPGMENLFGEIGIMQGGVSSANKVVTLSYGYFGVMCPLIWSGSIMTEPGSEIFAQAYGPLGSQMRLSSLLLKVMSTKEGMVLVDP